ncbi:hypothetical protein GCM10009069_27120 [Algimonas arctica]|uniref:DUF2207 domain-containing protein n=1 Tax=Algimonas arctica TaxID=1479486 RepID=A0A8J3G3I0_9PROT|nr:DUF2207 domain-containing protein [Algimonas arctica]GHB02929.1 hypothetical protein GCM10009069_27120 [Algimonas arctica]
MRLLLGLLLSLVWVGVSFAQERITNFDVDIEVETSGDIVITETIDVISTGDAIQRGIFRELPARYTFMGVSQNLNYDLISIERDARKDDVSITRNGNALVWRIGQADVFLDPGPHQYVIRYRVENAIHRHGDRDELYWNATGSYWDFPIDAVRATVRFPDGATFTDTDVYTGEFNSKASTADITVSAGTAIFTTTQPLSRKAGLTVSASIAPGVIAPMSAERKRELFWIRFGALFMLSGGGLALLLFYWRQWSRVGRDPQKPPVFARYEPPQEVSGQSYSPAAVHYIHHKGFRGMDAFSALLMQLGGQGALDIQADKKVTTIRRLDAPIEGKDAQMLVKLLLSGRGDTLVLDGDTDTAFHTAIAKFHQTIAKKYGPEYYRHNLGWAALGFVVSIILALIVILSPVAKNSLPVLGLFIALVVINGVFVFLLPAPTRYGAQISSEIDGFKLYLETAEEKRLNTADPLSERPPAMTVELYERFLPYAMALGVEKPWTKQFESSMPIAAKEYRPSYAHGNALRAGGSPVNFSKSLSKTLTAGVAASAPVSQSSGSGFSSGSGGGGFSGGGGGGGGGGGW